MNTPQPANQPSTPQSLYSNLWYILGAVILFIILVIISKNTGVKSPLNNGSEASSTATSTLGIGAGLSSGANANKSTYSSNNKNEGVSQSGSAVSNTGSGAASSFNATQVSVAIDNSVIIVPQIGVEAHLVQGSAGFSDGAVQGYVSVGPIIGQVYTNDGYDVFVETTLTKKDQPQAIRYLSTFRVVGDSVKYYSSFYIGDRVSLLSVVASRDTSVRYPAGSENLMDSFSGYLLTVNYLDRKNGEPLDTPPTVIKNLVVHVKNHIVQ